MRLALRRLQELGAAADAYHLLTNAIRSWKLSEDAALEITELALTWLSANLDSSEADYAFNRLLRRADLSDSDWRRAAEFAFSWLKHAHPERNPEYTFFSLLRCPQLLSPAEQTQLCDESLSWLVSRQQPDKASMRLLTRLLNALGNTDRGVDLRLARKCIEATTAHFQANGKRDDFTEYLWKMARTPSDRVDYEILAGALILSRASLAIHRPTNAALLLPSLLPLAYNSDDPGLQNAVRALAKDVLAHSQLRDTERQRLIKGSWHLLSVGGWSDQEAGQRILIELGLPSP